MKKNIKDDEKKIIDVINEIKPYLNSDGGDIEFVKYEDNYVYVKIHGACAGCEFIGYDLQDSIYEAIKEEVPDCKGILNTEI